jgi:hypothetical protein
MLVVSILSSYHYKRYQKALQIETLEEALKVIELLRNYRGMERIRGAFEYFPELRGCKNTAIANFLGLTRETVARYFSMEKKLRGRGIIS